MTKGRIRLLGGDKLLISDKLAIVRIPQKTNLNRFFRQSGSPGGVARLYFLICCPKSHLTSYPAGSRFEADVVIIGGGPAVLTVAREFMNSAATMEYVTRSSESHSSSIVLDEIRSGDILFFDGSHRAFQNSDVTVFFLEVLPSLPSGVTVQIHDIVLPEDYPPEWHTRLYSEQYLLAAMLLAKESPFRTLLPNCFACLDPVLRPKADALVTPHMSHVVGGSFWLETL
jgi:hypothetical protein